MKAIFIAYNQAYNEDIAEILASFKQRGFTRWNDIQGRGTFRGEPRMGDHAWPAMNNAILSMIPDEIEHDLLAALKATDEATPDLGLRAYTWTLDSSL